MTLHIPRLPTSLDPLIAEAKRRARARRFLLAAVVLVVAGGAAATAAFRSSDRPQPTAIAVGPTCRRAQLRIVSAGGGVAGGTAMQDFALLNTSGETCTLRGWPTLRLVLGNGRLIHPAVRRDHYGAAGTVPVRTISLPAGGAASFGIAGSDGTGTGLQTCKRVKTLLVTPTGVGNPLSRSGINPYCAPYRLFEVPFVSGRVDHLVGY
jgi:Protein of unknown function (DUF4232)